MSSACFAVIVLVEGLTKGMAMVNCGGHYETDCSACPAGHGPAWCNGDCAWLETGVAGAHCVVSTPGVGLQANDRTQNNYNYSVAFIVSGVIMLVYACCYNQKVIKGDPELPKVNSIMSAPRKGLFDCFWHPPTCMQVTFCMPVVAAKNYYATDVCPFWPGCILTYCGVYSPLFCLTAVFRAVMSGHVQDALGLRTSFWYNLLLSCFCFPCDVGRESLEIDGELAADIQCCCWVEYTPVVVAEVEKVVEKVERQCGCWEGH